MAVNDFTGKNIQDTYQRVVQTDGTNLADGTGSLLPISFDGNTETLFELFLECKELVIFILREQLWKCLFKFKLFIVSNKKVHNISHIPSWHDVCLSLKFRRNTFDFLV